MSANLEKDRAERPGTLQAMKQPALFIGHGVPSILASDGDPTRAWLERFGASLRQTPPSAIVCVSAHSVAPRFTVTTSDTIEPLQDHGVASLASLEYRPPGCRRVARRVLELLLGAGFDAIGDETRGIDHGAWLPLSSMFPAADVPVVELSLHGGLDPDVHFTMGRAIEPLRDEGVLVLGSGALSHDTAELEARARVPEPPAALSEASRRFEAWAIDILTRSAPYTRGRGLTRFQDHPDARKAHPTTEHFLPLLVVAGAASADRSQDNIAAIVHMGAQLGVSTAAFCFRR
jgi:4,5-DOPA dioxygenase extradiol